MIKKITFIIFCFFAILFAIVSCEKYLGIEPKRVLIPKTAKQYEMLLYGHRAAFGSNKTPAYLTDDPYIPDVSEGVVLGLDSRGVEQVRLYTFQPGIVYDESQSDQLWNEAYSRMFYCNEVIAGVVNAQGTQQEREYVKGSALMIRAYEYLVLVNIYAKHYDLQTAAADPGVPLILKADINQNNLIRASVQEVYDQVEKDLMEAEKGLPILPEINTYSPSKVAVWALLARMYLYKGNYTEALKYANQVLEKYGTLLDLKQYKVVNPDGSSRTDVPAEGIDHKENIFFRIGSSGYGNSGVDVTFVSDDLLSYFTENDQRLLLFATKAPMGVLHSRYVWFPAILQNAGIATPEIYLTAAECEARVGSVSKAMERLNALRDNRILNNTPLISASADDALKKILDERRRELAFVDCSRLIDLKRLNKDPRFAKKIEHIVNGRKVMLEPNSSKYLISIPQSVLGYNPKMKQNERN